jgi:hypothetical protein
VATSLLKKPADKNDRADMTGQTIVIDPGRYFH